MALKTLSADEEPPTPGEPPYKGLQYFSEEDAEWFFGREHVIVRLVEAIRTERFLAVIGASGSGKSSVLRAGLAPELKRGRIIDPAGEEQLWQIHIFTPGVHPLESLAVTLSLSSELAVATATLIDDLGADPRSLHLYVKKVLSSSRPIARLLLVVDQFEEFFTLCRDEEERQAFVDNLMYAVQIERGRSRS